MMKNLLLTAVATLGLTAASLAQTIPAYVPTNGLVGWWPFNGNGNDLSPSGNNLTTNGSVSYSSDRFGNSNSAALFDGANEYFYKISPILPAGNSSRTLSFWCYTSGTISNPDGEVPFMYGDLTTGGCYKRFGALIKNATQIMWIGKCNPRLDQINNLFGNWHHLVYIFNGTNQTLTLFQNGTLIQTSVVSGTDNTILGELRIGSGLDDQNPVGNVAQFDGKIDEVAVWDRVLTQQEITSLYNSIICAKNTSISPQTNSLSIGSTAVFTVSTTDTNPSYVWQSDFGQGYQTLNNFGSYSGVNTTTLNISNVQLANHNQKIRAISTTSNNCIDTSNVAQIVITNTCITNVTVYDTTIVYDTVTTYISVTDTLFIDINTTGINNNVINTIKVFPNPTNSHINLHFGDFNTLNGYSVKILNSLSQIIYNQPIIQQSELIDLNTFGGNGIYFLHIINAQNNTIEIRKIVLQ